MIQSPVVVCPGFHPPQLTAQFVRSVFGSAQIAERFCPLVVDAFCADPVAVFNWMKQTLGSPTAAGTQPVLAVGFSGGVVGISGALHFWQQQGGQVAKLIAIDGWGMPIIGLPVCRLSHDAFTHWSTLPLGAGELNFYANPSVDHLHIWGNPDRTTGQKMVDWQTQPVEKMTATTFIRQALEAEVTQG